MCVRIILPHIKTFTCLLSLLLCSICKYRLATGSWGVTWGCLSCIKFCVSRSRVQRQIYVELMYEPWWNLVALIWTEELFFVCRLNMYMQICLNSFHNMLVIIKPLPGDPYLTCIPLRLFHRYIVVSESYGTASHSSQADARRKEDYNSRVLFEYRRKTGMPMISTSTCLGHCLSSVSFYACTRLQANARRCNQQSVC